MVFRINSSHIVNRKDIVLGFASHDFTPSCLQCSHYIYPEYHSLPSYYICIYGVFSNIDIPTIYSKTAIQAVKKGCGQVWQPYTRWPGWKSCEIQVAAKKWLWWLVYAKIFNNYNSDQFVSLSPLPKLFLPGHLVYGCQTWLHPFFIAWMARFHFFLQFNFSVLFQGKKMTMIYECISVNQSDGGKDTTLTAKEFFVLHYMFKLKPLNLKRTFF